MCEKGNRAEGGYGRRAGGPSAPPEAGELLLDRFSNQCGNTGDVGAMVSNKALGSEVLS